MPYLRFIELNRQSYLHNGKCDIEVVIYQGAIYINRRVGSNQNKNQVNHTRARKLDNDILLISLTNRMRHRPNLTSLTELYIIPVISSLDLCFESNLNTSIVKVLFEFGRHA